MNDKIRRLWPSALAVFLFCALTIAQFWPALTGAISLSKVQQLAEWDSLFAGQKSGQSMLMDPSLAYYMVPIYLLKAALIKSGQLPLWDQYSGLGCPLAADPESLAFSPLHLPLIFSSGPVAYHQVLVLEIIILGLSTFALARSLKLGLFASAFAMVALAFCPFERWYLELLGNGFCFVPLVFWLILALRSKVTAAKVWITGFGCAMMVLTAHPELSFCSIAMASLALLLYVCFDRAALETVGYNKRLGHACLGLTAAGVLAFMLAAPMLMPFLEYLGNCDSYKYGNGAPAIVRWQTLAFNLLQPGFGGASPTLGPCALLLIPLAFSAAKNNKTLVAVLATLTLFCLAVTGKVFPLNLILAHPPFSYLVVNYAFPSAILMTALLAAFGLQTALSSAAGQTGANTKATINAPESHPKIGNLPLVFSLVLALLILIFPLTARALHLPLNSANFDMCLPDYAFNRNDVLRYSVFALLAGASVLAVKLKPSTKTAGFLIAAICLGQTAEIITAAKSMPQRAPFKYQETTVLPELKASTCSGNLRFVATGSHLFRPNSNVVFGLSDLRNDNALFPKRYLTYMQACGAHLDRFSQEFESPLSPLLALASVNSVLSQSPVISQAELTGSQVKEQRGGAKTLTIEPEAEIKASLSSTILDKQKRAIFAYLTIDTTAKRAAALSYNLVLYDAAGQVLWFSDARPLAPDVTQSRLVAIPTPVAVPDHGFLLGLQFFDTGSGKWLNKDAYIFGPIDFAQGAKVIADADYKLVFESSSRLRIYENVRALPRAYAVHHSLIVPSAEAALAAIQDVSFDPRQTVVIDTPGQQGPKEKHRPTDQILSPPIPDEKNGSITGLQTASSDTVTIAAITANQVVIEAQMGQAGIVVLNDIFYPGWQAQLNGRPVAILRADYLMRAVTVPQGKHRIVFTYRPMSFSVGFLLSIAALLIGLGLAIKTALRYRARKRADFSS
jgi:hypothetical protein